MSYTNFKSTLQKAEEENKHLLSEIISKSIISLKAQKALAERERDQPKPFEIAQLIAHDISLSAAVLYCNYSIKNTESNFSRSN